jgi:hypothetical protein
MARPPIKRLKLDYAITTFCYSPRKLRELFGKRKSLSWEQILELDKEEVPMEDKLLAISHCIIPDCKCSNCTNVYEVNCPSSVLCIYMDKESCGTRIKPSKVKRHLRNYITARKRELAKEKARK